ncbi:asparaginase [Streptomyces griseoincarnatus]
MCGPARAGRAVPRAPEGIGRGACRAQSPRTAPRGVHALGLPDGSAVALKIADGPHRVRPAVRVAALRRVGGDVDADDTLRDLASAPVLGHGEPVGPVRATLRDRRPGPPGAGAHRSSSIP